ncbi:MAG: dUMP phosphatase [Candidatus Latescibacteria bacterium ADurb.Bin168]|nr:MAG: dUMP phosphatase [Candidatus Latescibacteria bacterium ADurb.Bin168]
MVVTFEDTGLRKPAKEPFERVLSLLGVPPEEAVMVGDWPSRDVTGAKAVGLWTVWARYGDTFGTHSTDADYEIATIRDIGRVIEAINARMGGSERTR